MDDPDQAAAGECAAPMPEQQHSPLAQVADDESIQPHDLGSQESIFMQPNFSYVAMLQGYLHQTYGPGGYNNEEQMSLSSFQGGAARDGYSAADLTQNEPEAQNDVQEPLKTSNCEEQSTLSCFPAVSADDVSHFVEQTENERNTTSDQNGKGKQVESSVGQVQDLLHMGVFVEQGAESSYIPAPACYFDDTNKNVGGSREQNNDLSLHDPEEDPWRPDIFEDMVLERVTRNDEGANEAERMVHDHTWNLDSPREDDIKCSDQDEQTCQNNDNEVNEETIESFLENERQAAEEGNSYNTDSELKPTVGMQFKTREEAQNSSTSIHLWQGFMLPLRRFSAQPVGKETEK